MWKKTLWLTLCWLLATFWVPHSLSAELDPLIKRASATYMPTVDWRLWRAQIATESNFNCNATSPVGAMGCAQIMPATFREISRQSGIAGNPYAAEVSIMAGAYYMARQRAIFKAPRPDYERHNLAAAAYNSGAGNIIKAQRIAGNPVGWDPVAAVLPQVTGRHSIETVNYVRRIRETHSRYIAAGL